MSLIDNLNIINNCKEEIKQALINKGVDMSGVSFDNYAGKINELKIESGETDEYIYTNGYLTDGGDESDIIIFSSYKIDDFEEGDEYIINLTCPSEIAGYIDGDNKALDVIFTVDIPTTYNKPNLECFDEDTQEYVSGNFKLNPRYSTIVRNGVEYNSYVRDMGDNNYNNEKVSRYPLKYKITIEKI
jgi:hypothetical protein